MIHIIEIIKREVSLLDYSVGHDEYNQKQLVWKMQTLVKVK